MAEFERDSAEINEAIISVCHEDPEVHEAGVSRLAQLAYQRPEETLQLIMHRMQSLLQSENETVLLQLAAAVIALVDPAEQRSQETANQLTEMCIGTGIMDMIFSLIHSQDILVQAIAMEYLPCFSTTPAGLQWLFKDGHIAWLLHQAATLGNGCRDALTSPSPSYQIVKDDEGIAVACMDALSDVMSKGISADQRETLNRFLTNSVVCDLHHCIVLYMETGMERHRTAALKVVTALCCVSFDSFHWTLLNTPVMSLWMELVRGSIDAQGAVLHSLATVLEAQTGLLRQCTGTEVLARDHSLVRFVHMIGDGRQNQSTMTYLLQCGRSPVDPVHLGAVNLMTALAKHPSLWGLNLLFSHTEFFPYAVDRTTETTKAGMEAKYALVCAILDNQHRDIPLQDIAVSMLQKIRVEGPFRPPGGARLGDLQTMEH